MRIFTLLWAIFAVSAYAYDSGINVSYVSMIPSTLPTVCTLGDLRFDSSSSSLQFCGGSNNWGAPGTSVMTTLGDIIYENSTPAAARLAGNTLAVRKFLSQTGTGSISAAPAWNSLANADIPHPTATSLGGIESYTSVSHQWINAISTEGVPSSTQPAFNDVSGSVASLQLPAPGANNLGGVDSYASVSNQWINAISTAGVPSSTQPAFNNISGSVASLQLPAPSSANLGGVDSYVGVANQWINSIGTTGLPTSTQPAFNNISGSVASLQLPAPGATHLGGVDSYASVSNQWINAISTTGAPSSSQPAFSDVSGSVASLQLPAPASTHLGGVDSYASVSNQWINAIGTTGLPTSTQPNFTNLAGSLAVVQMTTTGVTAGSYTNSSITVNGQGLVTAASTGSSGSVLPGYLSGNSLAYLTTTTFNTGIGTVSDSTAAVYMTLAAAISKSTSSWVVGTGNGGLDTGTIASTTWYHVFVIERTDLATTDVLFSLSATAPTMPANYTYKRRIGSILTNGSSQFVQWVQYNDYFLWLVMVQDSASTNPGTSAVTRTLGSVPTGVVVMALFAPQGASGTAQSDTSILYTALTQTDSAQNNTQLTLYLQSPTAVQGEIAAPVGIWTNTSAQIRSRTAQSVSDTTWNINTIGWMDPRGQR